MSNVLRLIFISILDFFGQEEKYEKKVSPKILFFLVLSFLYGYVLFRFFTLLTVSSFTTLFTICFCISSFFSFFYTFVRTKTTLFKVDAYLFSLPLSKKEIFISKFFFFYLQNVWVVLVLMVSLLSSYIVHAGSVDLLFLLTYVFLVLGIPILPMVLGILGFSCFFQLKKKSSKWMAYGFVFAIGIFLLVMVSFLPNKEDVLVNLCFKLSSLYPLAYLFSYIIETCNSLFLFLYIAFLLVCFLLLIQSIEKYYFSYCFSIIDNKKEIPITSYKRYFPFLGWIRKEFWLLKNTSFYLNNTIFPYFLSSILFTGISFYLNKIEWFRSYLPTLLAMLVFMFTCSPYMLQEEKKVSLLFTYPISFKRIYFGKIGTSFLVSLFFLLWNSLVSLMCYSTLTFYEKVFVFLVPLASLFFISCLNITLLFLFFDKSWCKKLVSFLTVGFSLIIGFVPFFIRYFATTTILLSTLVVYFLLGGLGSICLFLLKEKSIKKKLLKQR